MADWNTHLYCAGKVNEKLDFEEVQRDMFLFGNIIPDINPGWVIEPEKKIEQYITHFDEEKSGPAYFWEAYRFYKKYQSEIKKKNPAYLGFLLHLWVDVKLTADFMSRVPMSQMISRGIDVREWKWKDNLLFIHDYPQSLSKQNIASVVEAAKGIDEIDITEKDLEAVADFIESHIAREDISEYEYHVYDKKSMGELFEKICLDFIAWLERL